MISKRFAMGLHAISTTVAFITTTIQTARIIKNVRQYNIMNISVLLSGLLVASVGTLAILNKLNKIIK